MLPSDWLQHASRNMTAPQAPTSRVFTSAGMFARLFADAERSLSPEYVMMAGKAERKGKADLYRMVSEEHLCPFGLKTKDLLQRHGFDVDDHPLESRADTDAFMQKAGVDTTPQVYLGGERIGGYEDVRAYLGMSVPRENETSYAPVVALFAVALLTALAVAYAALETILQVRTLEFFVAISMVLLGLQKLKDLESFSTMFLNYDLLARRHVRYGYFYPFGETLAGVLMLAGSMIWLAAPVALFIGSVGAVSVFKAVYMDRRELKCACVGGDSKVPLGFISLTENLIMIAMAVWMPIRMYVL